MRGICARRIENGGTEGEKRGVRPLRLIVSMSVRAQRRESVPPGKEGSSEWRRNGARRGGAGARAAVAGCRFGFSDVASLDTVLVLASYWPCRRAIGLPGSSKTRASATGGRVRAQLGCFAREPCTNHHAP